MKLFQSHAVCNGTEICNRDFIHKVKIELLKEKLLNNPPPHQKKKKKKAEKRICFDNEAASTSLQRQVTRSGRRSVAPVNGIFLYFAKSQNPERRSNHLHHSM